MTLMMPKASASPRPSIHEKYHMKRSILVEAARFGPHLLDRDLAAQDAVDPGRVSEHDGQQHYHNPEHDLERAVARNGVPRGEAACGVGARWHHEREHREARGQDDA